MSEDAKETMGQLFDRGLKLRREVLGAEYVDNSMKNTNEFMMAFQHITTEWCWGYGWGRPGLDKKTRSMLNLAMLTASANRPRSGCMCAARSITVSPSTTSRKCCCHATVYCGIPAGLDAFKNANEVLKEMGKVSK